MMPEPSEGVTYKELTSALNAQTITLVHKMNRVEDKLLDDIGSLKKDSADDVQRVEDRVEKLESRTRTENIIATVVGSVLTFIGLRFT